MKRTIYAIFSVFCFLLPSLAQINTGGGGTGGGTGTSPTTPAYLVTASPYNAKCDNSTDDVTAIQSAITDASSTHGTVIFPAGTCKISAALTVAAGTSGLTLTGQQPGSTAITQTTTSADIIDVNGTVGSHVNSLLIKNLSISRGAGFTATPKGFSFTYCDNCSLAFVQAVDSYYNFYTVSGTNDTWSDITSVGSASTINSGIVVDNATNSLFIEKAVIAGTHTVGLKFLAVALDTFVYRLETTSTTATGILISAIGSSDVHIINPILDTCTANCINITGSTAGALGSTNNIQIVDCWCNTGTGATPSGVLISGSEGVHILGGTFVERGTGGGYAIGIQAGSVRNSVVGAHVINDGTTDVNIGIGITGALSGNNLVSGNTVNAPTGHAWNLGIYVGGSSIGLNTITGNTVSGYVVATGAGMAIDSSTTGTNVITGNIIDSAHITLPMVDQISGNVYAATTLAPGIIGNAVSYKTTSAITGPVPVKMDTGAANQVAITTTTDTAAGIPVGVCVNAAAAAGSCLVMTSGIVPMILGTGTCSIGQFVKVDTTTNGRVLCSTYTAGTVIGTAQSAQAAVGSALNVAIGLK